MTILLKLQYTVKAEKLCKNETFLKVVEIICIRWATTCIKKKYQKPYFGLEPWSQSRIAIYRYWTGSASQDNFGSTGFAIKKKKLRRNKISFKTDLKKKQEYFGTRRYNFFFTCVDQTNFMNTDPIWIRIQN